MTKHQKILEKLLEADKARKDALAALDELDTTAEGCDRIIAAGNAIKDKRFLQRVRSYKGDLSIPKLVKAFTAINAQEAE